MEQNHFVFLDSEQGESFKASGTSGAKNLISIPPRSPLPFVETKSTRFPFITKGIPKTDGKSKQILGQLGAVKITLERKI
jgi:hypothetical protein